MKRCKNCKWSTSRRDIECSIRDFWSKEHDCTYYTRKPWMGWLWLVALIFIITLALLLAGCSPGQHHGHIYIHDPNHVEAIFDVPMSMSVEKDGIKVEASSKKAGLLEDIIKLLLLRPR